MSTPMRRIRSGCCARAEKGHAIAPPPITLMKSRRLIAAPSLERQMVATSMGTQKRPHVRFGSKADICGAKRHVRFAPESDRESGHPQTVMSALPPKADIYQ